MPELRMREWDRIAASDEARGAPLRGVFLDDPEIAAAADRLTTGRRLLVTEERSGLVVRSFQHVGVVQLGPLRIRIDPKLEVTDLWHILAYALGLRRWNRLPPAGLELSAGFVDLLALLLAQEADALFRTGIRRGYVGRREWLSVPRGRPDMARIAAHSPLTRPALPCHHHAFETDTPDNSVVLSGLVLARRLASLPLVVAEVGRGIQRWSEICVPIPLDRAILDTVDRARNRLTSHYGAAHRLVRVFVEHAGLDDDRVEGEQAIPGFLWNMATLFEAFVTRFLSENLIGVEVRPQRTIRQLYRAISPSGTRAPRPRPDLVVLRGGAVEGVFDTKYRDLSRGPIPREILYQLSVYALAWQDDRGRDVPATVLYPFPGAPPPDRVLALRHGFRQEESRIRFRGIDWSTASRALRARGPSSREHASAWIA